MDSAGFGAAVFGAAGFGAAGFGAAGKQHYREERTVNGKWYSVNSLLQWFPEPIATVATVWKALCPLSFSASRYV